MSDHVFHLRGFSDDHDHSRAIFVLDELLDNTERRDDLIFRRFWERALLGDPPLSIKVCHAINDTPLPDLQIDQRLKTLSFCWREMFTQLLGEEKAAVTVWDSWQNYLTSSLASRPAWTTSRDAMDDFASAAKTWARIRLKHGLSNVDSSALNGIMGTCQFIARRGRLRRQCKALLGTTILDDYTTREQNYPRRHARRWDASRYPLWRIVVKPNEYLTGHEEQDAGVSDSMIPPPSSASVSPSSATYPPVSASSSSSQPPRMDENAPSSLAGLTGTNTTQVPRTSQQKDGMS